MAAVSAAAARGREEGGVDAQAPGDRPQYGRQEGRAHARTRGSLVPDGRGATRIVAPWPTPSSSSRRGTRRPRSPRCWRRPSRELPGADLLVIDDGSTDDTAEVARSGGAQVVSFPENHGLRPGIAEGYRQASTAVTTFCGRLDADGQHPPAELKRMLELVRSDECDVAVGSRFLPGSGEYAPAPERVFGTSLLRLLMRLRLGQPISDGTSGMYAVNHARSACSATLTCARRPRSRR